jgi:3-oxoacyl-[acyl-carrier protein] reductase
MLQERLEQKRYVLDEIEVGQSAEFSVTVTDRDVETFAQLSGDYSDLHMNAEFARRTRFRDRCAHGMLSLTSVSTLVGMCLPGANAVLLAIDASFLAPVRIGDSLGVRGTAVAKSLTTRVIKLRFELTNLSTRQRTCEGHAEVFVGPPPRRGLTMRELEQLDLDIDFTGKTVVVTGASRGVGELTAKVFAEKGANVVVNYRLGQQDAAAIVRDITDHGRRAIAVRADVTILEEVQAMFSEAVGAFGGIDVLVNNAVRDATPVPFEQLTWDSLQQDIDVVVKGAFLCCQAALPHLVQRGGSIVNVSTIYTEAPVPHLVSYVAAKSALVGMTRALAVEFAERNVRVNLVTPSIMPTDLTATLSERAFKRLADGSPMKRTCEPIDVAKAILMLASSYARYTTGHQLMVTGGALPLW